MAPISWKLRTSPRMGGIGVSALGRMRGGGKLGSSEKNCLLIRLASRQQLRFGAFVLRAHPAGLWPRGTM